jgi:hypothetical protein
MLREGSDDEALLGLCGQLLEMEDVRPVVLIRVVHRNTPEWALGKGLDIGGQLG